MPYQTYFKGRSSNHKPFGLLFISTLNNKLGQRFNRGSIMRRALISVVFAGCIGAVPAHPRVGMTAQSNETATLMTRQLGATPIKISTTGREQQVNSDAKNRTGEPLAQGDSGGRGGGRLLAVLMLMGAIALRRSKSGKF